MKINFSLEENIKTIPTFKNEDEEIEFWNENDSTEYIDWDKARVVSFPNLEPSKKNVTLEIEISIFEKLMAKSKKDDLPFESLINKFIEEGLNTSNI